MCDVGGKGTREESSRDAESGNLISNYPLWSLVTSYGDFVGTGALMSTSTFLFWPPPLKIWPPNMNSATAATIKKSLRLRRPPDRRSPHHYCPP